MQEALPIAIDYVNILIKQIGKFAVSTIKTN